MKSKGLILAFLATVFLSVNVPALDFTVKNITIEQAIMQINMKFGYSIVVNASDVDMFVNVHGNLRLRD